MTRDRAGAGDLGVDVLLQPAAVAQPGQRVVLGQVAHQLELAGGLHGTHRVVRERAQRLQHLVGRAAGGRPGRRPTGCPRAGPRGRAAGRAGRGCPRPAAPRPLRRLNDAACRLRVDAPMRVSRSMRITPSRSSAGSSSASIAVKRDAGRGARARSSDMPTVRPHVEHADRRRVSETTTFSNPSASRTPVQTASSISSAVRRSARRAVSRSRWSTDTRWRSAAAACWTCSSASAACAATPTSRSSSSSVGRLPLVGSSTDRMPRISPRAGAQRDEQRVVGMPGVGVRRGRELGGTYVAIRSWLQS